MAEQSVRQMVNHRLPFLDITIDNVSDTLDMFILEVAYQLAKCFNKQSEIDIETVDTYTFPERGMVADIVAILLIIRRSGQDIARVDDANEVYEGNIKKAKAGDAEVEFTTGKEAGFTFGTNLSGTLENLRAAARDRFRTYPCSSYNNLLNVVSTEIVFAFKNVQDC